MLYTRAQLRLLLGLGATLCVGLGVREWRAGFPALAERLERFDRGDTDAVGESAAAAGVESGRARAPRPTPGPANERVDAQQPKGQDGPLDVNRATVTDLARLPGVGAGLARRIVQERDRRGGFDSPESLRLVYGMGPRKLAAIRDLITVADRRPSALAGRPPGGSSDELTPAADTARHPARTLPAVTGGTEPAAIAGHGDEHPDALPTQDPQDGISQPASHGPAGADPE